MIEDVDNCDVDIPIRRTARCKGEAQRLEKLVKFINGAFFDLKTRAHTLADLQFKGNENHALYKCKLEDYFIYRSSNIVSHKYVESGIINLQL